MPALILILLLVVLLIMALVMVVVYISKGSSQEQLVVYIDNGD